MSHISTGIFGALAVTATLGAIQFASGSDLGKLRGEFAPAPAQVNSYAVNRAAKADRAAIASASTDRSQTLSFRVDSLADTSVAMRLPAIQPRAQASSVEAKTEKVPTGVTLSRTERKPAVACEPMVSVLTDVAKLLQPGRCIT